MSSFSAVAELFASLGLDSAQFKEGLVQATADFETFAASLGSATAQYESNIAQIATLMGASAEDARDTVESLRQSMVVTNEATGLLEDSLSLEGAAILTLQKLKKDDAALDAQILAANKTLQAEKKADQAEYAAWFKTNQAQLRSEMEATAETEAATASFAASLRKQVEAELSIALKQYMAEEAAATKAGYEFEAEYAEAASAAKAASEKNYQSLVSQLRKEEEVAFKAQIDREVAAQKEATAILAAMKKDEAAAAKLAAEEKIGADEATVESAGRVRAAYGGIFSNAAVEARVLTQEVGGLSGGMGTLLARVPILGQALEAIFPIVIAGVFIDVIVHIGEEIGKLIVDMVGFDKVSVKAWDDAREGAVKAQAAYIEYQAKLREAPEKGLKGSALDIANIGDTKQHFEDLKASTQQLEAARDNQKKIADLALTSDDAHIENQRAALEMQLKGQLGFVGYREAVKDAAEAVKEYQAQITKNYKEMADLNIKLVADESKKTKDMATENDKREKQEAAHQKEMLRMRLEGEAIELRLMHTATSGPGSQEQLLNKGAVPSEATGLAEITQQLKDVTDVEKDQIFLMQKTKETALTDPWGVSILKDGKFAVEDFRIAQASLAKELQHSHQQAQLFNRVIFQASTTFINDVASLASGKETVHAFFISLVDDLDKMILKLTILEPLTNYLKGAFSGTGGGGGFLSGLAGLFGIHAGGGAASFASQVDIPSTSFLDSITPFGGALAEGGTVSPGMGYLVGENGPEPFFPDTPGTVLPNSSLNGSGNSVIITNNNDFRGAHPGSEAAIIAALKDVHARAVSDSMAAMNAKAVRTP